MGTFMAWPCNASPMRLGVKAALSDAHQMAELDVDFLEVHLRRDDLTRHRDALVRTFVTLHRERDLGMVVHVPEFMVSPEGSILVDIACDDETLRRMSIGVLEATIDFARAIDATLVVVHPGGVLPTSSDARAEGAMGRLLSSLGEVRDAARTCGVLLTLENMPWCYHLKSDDGEGTERWASTLLVGPSDFDAAVGEVDGMTLDVSHGFLHSPEGGMEVVDSMLEHHLDRILHLHLSDALPPDHEGLQIGEGAVDIQSVVSAFEGRDISAVPEIIGGHRQDGLGFRRALEELRRMVGARSTT